MRLITASAGRYPRKAGIWIVGAMAARPAHNRRVLVRFQDDPPLIDQPRNGGNHGVKHGGVCSRHSFPLLIERIIL